MAALPSFKQLQYLVALSEHLSFTRAAEASYVTQSTLSAGLKELEDVLGARLVERDRQTVLMTPAGLEAVARARVLLAGAQDLVEFAAGAGKVMTGLLRLGVIPTIAPFLLPAVLPALRARYPDLQLALREDLTGQLLSRLADGQLDFALIALPYDTADLLVEPLFDEPLWLVARKGDPAAKAGRAHAAAPPADRLLLLEEGHCLREHALYACGTTKRKAAAGLEATSLLTLVQMVESGLGVGLVPEMAVKSGLTQSPTLAARAMGAPAPRRTVALVARRSTSRLADLKALGDVVRKVGATGGRGGKR